ncbi:hypothetical protein Daesc_001637 [Daldinia eschscholtzii]|uniref:Transmembrane protein n=1 Tax=Daldinia eschscholtzii TaxID=292717 RepID=A0AAX6MUL9_9PEZI
MYHQYNQIHSPITPPLPSPPPPLQNAFDSQPMEERWTQYLRNRHIRNEESGTSATVEQQNWYHGHSQGHSTAIQHPLSPVPVRFQRHKLLDEQDPLAVMGFLSDYTRRHEPGEYHEPDSSLDQDEEQGRVAFGSSPPSPFGSGGSDSPSSVDTVIPINKTSSYISNVEGYETPNSLDQGPSGADRQSTGISFQGLVKMIVRKVYTLTISTTNAGTQTSPFNGGADTHTGINDDTNGSIGGIQGNSKARASCDSSGSTSSNTASQDSPAVGEGVRESIDISTQGPTRHVRFYEPVRSVAESPAVISQGNNNGKRGGAPIATPAFSAPSELNWAHDNATTLHEFDTHSSTTTSGAANTSPTRTPAPTRAGSPANSPSNSSSSSSRGEVASAEPPTTVDVIPANPEAEQSSTTPAQQEGYVSFPDPAEVSGQPDQQRASVSSTETVVINPAVTPVVHYWDLPIYTPRPSEGSTTSITVPPTQPQAQSRPQQQGASGSNTPQSLAQRRRHVEEPMVFTMDDLNVGPTSPPGFVQTGSTPQTPIEAEWYGWTNPVPAASAPPPPYPGDVEQAGVAPGPARLPFRVRLEQLLSNAAYGLYVLWSDRKIILALLGLFMVFVPLVCWAFVYFSKDGNQANPSYIA